MDRRQFLNWVGVGCLANCLPVAIAACSSSPKTGSPEGFWEVGTLEQLDQDGQILNEEASDPVLVVRDATHSETIVAVNPTCTHRDCLVEWKNQDNAFLCTCHDSKFDLAGKVLGPPATENLVTYQVKVERDRILIRSA